MKVDMHVHSDKSDGRDSVRSLIEAAERMGLDLLAITDHGPGHGSGVTERQVRQTKKEAELLQPSYRVKVLVGIEAEVLPNGELYLLDREGMDIVIASLHNATSFKSYYQAAIRAVEDRRVDVLAHFGGGFGLSVEQDAEYEDRLIKAMSDNGVAVEINARYCLPSWDFLFKCRDAGVKYTIGSDAHKAADVGSAAWATNTARHVYGKVEPHIPSSR